MQICKAFSIFTLAAAAVAAPTPLRDETNAVPPLPGSEKYHFACWNRNLEEYCDGKAVCGASGMTIRAAHRRLVDQAVVGLTTSARKIRGTLETEVFFDSQFEDLL
ncbi:hypothetical protein CIB48_g12065 [Xylaria polymorpha]|nr:hypothetical protein CIB48_g12065 [Xylaria polymorpha]